MKKMMQQLFAFALLCLSAMQANAQCPGWNTPYPLIYITDNTPPTVDCQWIPNNAQYPLTYSWVFDDGFTSTASTRFTHIFATAGMHSVVTTITDATGCSFTRTEPIDFNNPCTADFTLSGANTVLFTPTVAGYWGQSHWDFGDGTSETNASTTAHFYQTPGTYNVCFNASFAANGCNSTACHPVTITNVSCGFFGNGATGAVLTTDMIQVNLGTNNTVDFAISTSSALNLALDSIKTTWDFGDGMVLTTPNATISHQFAQSGSKTVCVTAQAKIAGTTTWCSDSYCRTFSINDCNFNPFTFQNYQNQPTNVFFINDNASSGCGSRLQHWDFGDGTPAIDTFAVGSPLMHVFPDTGSYTVCLGMNTGVCFNNDCQIIHLGSGQPCSLAIDSLATQLQFDGTYQVYPASVSGSIGDYTYHWNDGTDGMTASVTGGMYAVTITDITGCTAVARDTLPMCHTAFQGGASWGAGSTVARFYNQSSTFTNYLWDFGDGTSSNERSPIHTYQQAGTYTVCLNTVNIPLFPCDPVLGAPNPCPPNECMNGQYCQTITVVQDNDCAVSKCVFPGDTNYDGVADMNDLLPIGAAYNMWGNSRWYDTQDILWYPHNTADWQTVFASAGLNHKQIDCNGDGYINATDITAIAANYNRTHNTLLPTNRGTNVLGIPMFLNHSLDTLFTAPNYGGIVYSDIMIGTPTQTVTLGYGAAMRIEYPTGMLDATQPIEVTWDANSWLADGTPTITLVHNDSINGILDIAISRTNQINAPTGQGKVGRIKWVITDNINGRPSANNAVQSAQPFTTTVTEAKLVNKILIPKTVQSLGSSVVVVSSNTVATENTAWKNSVRIFPNPITNGKLNIVAHNIAIESVVLHNILGQNVVEIRNINANTYTLDTAALPQGAYLLTIQTAKGVMTERVLIP